MRAATQKFKMNPFQQSHFRQKEENELGNEINNGDLKHLLPKKKKKRSCSQNATFIVLKI